MYVAVASKSAWLHTNKGVVADVKVSQARVQVLAVVDGLECKVI
jgi:hypothetical protein